MAMRQAFSRRIPSSEQSAENRIPLLWFWPWPARCQCGGVPDANPDARTALHRWRWRL